MKHDFVRVCALTPALALGNPERNADEIIRLIKDAAARGVEVAVFPELCVTGYTCADLFFSRELIDRAATAAKNIAAQTPKGIVAFVGVPIAQDGRLYNCAVGLSAGRVLGAVPKAELPEYGEFYEKRYFTPAFDGVKACSALGGVPIGNVLFGCSTNDKLVIGCEVCEDMWVDAPPSIQACRAGATIIVNPSASDEVIGKAEYRELLVKSLSGRLHCAYVYSDAGKGESSTDTVFAAHNIIAENGVVLDCSTPFGSGVATTDIDLGRLDVDRRKYGMKTPERTYETVRFELGDGICGNRLLRAVERYPFLPSGDGAAARSELILAMQAEGLKRRMDSTHTDKLVIGVSGGLDSSLALLVACRAAPSERIMAVTMPCFGTTMKTRGNAEALCKALGVGLTTIDIKATVTSHLDDIGHKKTDVTYENAQARMRTLTLFDIANKHNGLVVGTGDMSELALGWCTYGGDHMSSYGVNAGVPKTLVKLLAAHEGKRMGGDVESALAAILNTEISPELLPPENGTIAQKTEDILGKYDLLDFIMYYYCRYGFGREKIEFLLRTAYGDANDEDIKKALDTFFKRFFMSQFKRSCMPDGVKIGSVSLSPRSDFRLPSDIE